ncbi:MAG: PfkB family carbohydrate kinase [bacterium]|nr:hypothetical protein [Acidimicrobiia bacterium]MCY4649673.1 PfkB family carbohydrate kinase [bacterium]
MMRLLCVCPNPAIDHTVITDRLQNDETTRAGQSRTTAGGKGINLARFAAAFGLEAQTVACCGGLGAELLQALCEQDRLTLRTALAPAAKVRICPILVSTSDALVISTSDPPPIIDPATWASFVDLVSESADDADVICVSGSFPTVKGVPAAEMLFKALGGHTEIWVDTSGAPLVAAVRHLGKISIKVNLAEAVDLAMRLGLAVDEDIPVGNTKARTLGACEVLGGYIDNLIVTAGRAGAAHKTSGELRWLTSPTVETRNPTASGDAFLAGYLAAGHGTLSEVADPLLAGVCAGAANASTWFPEARAEVVADLARLA